MSNFYFIFLGDSSSSLWFVAGPLILLFCLRIRPHFMDSSIVLFVAVLSTVSGQIRLLCLQEIRLHSFIVDSSTVAYKAWLYDSLFCYFV